MTEQECTYDLIIVGSGGGGMTAALTAKALGLEPLVLEKSALFGGSTARSGGALWVPNNHLLAEDGVRDSLEDARTYLSHTVGDSAPRELQETFLLHAPRLIEWLRDNTCVCFQRMPGYSDYYPFNHSDHYTQCYSNTFSYT